MSITEEISPQQSELVLGIDTMIREALAADVVDLTDVMAMLTSLMAKCIAHNPSPQDRKDAIEHVLTTVPLAVGQYLASSRAQEAEQ